MVQKNSNVEISSTRDLRQHFSSLDYQEKRNNSCHIKSFSLVHCQFAASTCCYEGSITPREDLEHLSSTAASTSYNEA